MLIIFLVLSRESVTKCHLTDVALATTKGLRRFVNKTWLLEPHCVEYENEMEKDFKLSKYLSLHGNPSENWRRSIQRFNLYLTTGEMMKKSDPTCCCPPLDLTV